MRRDRRLAAGALALTPLLLAGCAGGPRELGPSRPFPSTALRGSLAVVQPPVVTLNGQPARLAPGARIFSADNRLLLSGQAGPRPLLVHYTLEDTTGLIKDVWVLTPAEAARQPWPRNVDEQRRWAYNPSNQTWAAKR